jgi:hypothetical protein
MLVFCSTNAIFHETLACVKLISKLITGGLCGTTTPIRLHSHVPLLPIAIWNDVTLR